MVINEALEIFKSKMPDKEAVRCFEYKTIFVFQFAPKNLTETDKYDSLLNSLVSVNKTDKSIKPFLPLHIPIDEYRNGVEIFLDRKRGML